MKRIKRLVMASPLLAKIITKITIAALAAAPAAEALAEGNSPN